MCVRTEQQLIHVIVIVVILPAHLCAPRAAAVALWPHSAASWWWVAQAHLAVLQRSGAREAAEAARVALTQANLCDRWDGRTWEQLALHEFRCATRAGGGAACTACTAR